MPGFGLANERFGEMRVVANPLLNELSSLAQFGSSFLFVCLFIGKETVRYLPFSLEG